MAKTLTDVQQLQPANATVKSKDAMVIESACTCNYYNIVRLFLGD